MERVTLPQRDGGINIWQSLERLLIFGKTSGARSFVSGRAKRHFGKPEGRRNITRRRGRHRCSILIDLTSHLWNAAPTMTPSNVDNRNHTKD
jgi:hypothetical protein